MTTTKPWLELQHICARDGWRFTDLAKAAGVSRESIRLYLLGERSPRPDTIKKFAAAMKVPYSVLAPSPRDGDMEHTSQGEDNKERAVTP